MENRCGRWQPRPDVHVALLGWHRTSENWERRATLPACRASRVEQEPFRSVSLHTPWRLEVLADGEMSAKNGGTFRLPATTWRHSCLGPNRGLEASPFVSRSCRRQLRSITSGAGDLRPAGRPRSCGKGGRGEAAHHVPRTGHPVHSSDLVDMLLSLRSG